MYEFIYYEFITYEFIVYEFIAMNSYTSEFIYEFILVNDSDAGELGSGLVPGDVLAVVHVAQHGIGIHSCCNNVSRFSPSPHGPRLLLVYSSGFRCVTDGNNHDFQPHPGSSPAADSLTRAGPWCRLGRPDDP